MAITLTNIPRIMRHHGWANGARLLETWFNNPVTTAPVYGPPETSTIRMDTWLLTFPRARRVYEQMIRERVWANDAARMQLRTVLARTRILGSTGTYDPLPLPTPDVDPLAINFRAVSFGFNELDDLSAALGNFVFKVAVAGDLARTSAGRTQLTVRHIGLFIRDSFDFNGTQFLGYWDDTDNSVSTKNPFSGTGVWNSDFRTWRTRNRRGGDFLVFSDVKRLTLSKPDVITL